jgi:arginine exporter protein ArgO
LDFALLKISMCRWDMFSLLDCEKLSDAVFVCVCVLKLLCLSLAEIWLYSFILGLGVFVTDLFGFDCKGQQQQQKIGGAFAV